MFSAAVNQTEMELTQIQRTLLAKMAQIFESNLPDSLYLNHYLLAEMYGFSPSEWNSFLKIKEIDRLIQAEISVIAEIGARHALANLQKGYASSADVSAAKELLANSKLLQQNLNQRPQIIITRVGAKKHGIKTTT